MQAEAQTLTAADYPPGREATAEEVESFCKKGEQAHRAQLRSYVPEAGEYPFQIIFCNVKTVNPYKCSTLKRLVDFEYDIALPFNMVGADYNEETARRFKDLTSPFLDHCTPAIS